MKIFVITALSLMLTLMFGTDLFSQSWKTYNTKDNPRAQGVTLSVDYPGTYQLGLDSGNQIIAYFMFADFNHGVIKTLQVMVVGDPSFIEDKEVRESFKNDDNYDLCSLPDSETKSIIGAQEYQQYSSGLFISPNFNKKTVNGVCGLQYDATNTFSDQGIPFFASIDSFLIGYMNKTVGAPRFVTLTCNTTGMLEDKNIIQEAHRTDSAAVCNQFFNSLKIYDR
ncbi:MAG: hypothetical protein LBD17_01725 [Endomicrobium sp.]|jgi:hypothetical protein|nr:hypothetical protein [Endomicrobium sp.]